MTQDQRAYFLRRFESMDADDLAIAASNELSDAASAALDEVLAKRGLARAQLAQSGNEMRDVDEHVHPPGQPGHLNRGLYLVHRIIFWIYLFVFASVALFVLINEKTRPESLAVLVFELMGLLALCMIPALHFAASVGARNGSDSGRVLSTAIGVIMLAGIPVGTALGIYILIQTSRHWQQSALAAAPAQG